MHSPSLSLSSALPPPRRRTRRKNHLRPKIPTKAQPPQTLIQAHHQLLLIQEVEHPPPSESARLVEAEAEGRALLESESVDPFLLPGDRWIPGSVLGIAIRFAALLAVQTAVAVWFLGRSVEVVEEEVGARVRVRVSEEAEEGTEFEKAVSEIREMAREAREQEVRKAENDAERLKGEMGRGITRLRRSLVKEIMDKEEEEEEEEEESPSSTRKGVRFVRETKELVSESDAKEAKDEKDFTNVEVTKLTKSLLKGISEKGDELSSSSSRRKKVGFVKSKSRSLSAPKGFNARNRRNKDIDVVETGGIQQIAHDNPVKESRNFHEPRESSSKQGNGFTTTMSSYVNGSSESDKDGEEESKVAKCQDKFSPQDKPWWKKLPYVLVILLHRRLDDNCPKGLYSLKMDSPSGDDGSASYTILFQDQGDARNFCCLLESFFEGLDDFSADVVPLTIPELERRVRSNAMKVIVVKKGEVDLYAGQPLTEVETVLRSLVD